MDHSTIDYDQSLNDLQQQKEQLELMMRKMGEEWEASGPGINWLKAVQIPNLQSDELAETTMIKTKTTVTNPLTTIKKEFASSSAAATRASMDKGSAAYHLVSPLTPDDTPNLTSDGELIHILQQPQPSPEYLQSLLHVNETLLAQSLAATPLTDNNIDYPHVPTAAASTTFNVLSPSSEDSSDVYTPILTSSSSITMQTPPTTPEDEQVIDQ